MTRYYLVPDVNDPKRLVKVGARGFTPPHAIPIPDEFKNEDDEWLHVVDVRDNRTGEIVSRNVLIDETKKAQALARKQAGAQKEQEKATHAYTLDEAIDALLESQRGNQAPLNDILQRRAAIKAIDER